LNDEELQELVKAKPLLGVPYTCKDAIEVEGQVVTCGIYSQQGVKCTSSAEVIKRMNAAGAILIALTNVPEVCMWVESQNGIYGRTKNPYDTRRSVGGSSGGEGALISAAGSLIGVGSDIGGSIRIPSFSNGVFGMKNTPGKF
uniref:Amidase domain-containing protein n=1 Tax=Heligmosomoides polygyrus TaxID=6339 RepID=A0A183GLD8_HELPZ